MIKAQKTLQILEEDLKVNFESHQFEVESPYTVDTVVSTVHLNLVKRRVMKLAIARMTIRILSIKGVWMATKEISHVLLQEIKM